MMDENEAMYHWFTCGCSQECRPLPDWIHLKTSELRCPHCRELIRASSARPARPEGGVDYTSHKLRQLERRIKQLEIKEESG